MFLFPNAFSRKLDFFCDAETILTYTHHVKMVMHTSYSKVILTEVHVHDQLCE